MDFSSVFIIINLQTWVLLLDYLGIGIPTPPPSHPDTPDGERAFPAQDREPGNGPASRDQGIGRVSSEHSTSRVAGLVDESLLSDARDLLSLDAEVGNSMYTSAYQSIPSGGREKTPETGGAFELGGFSDLSNIQEEYSHVTTPLSGGRVGGSVWGVEGKLSLQVKLNVNSLTVTFNKLEHPLARGGVAGVSAEVKLRRGNIEISGSLGQGSVMDMTETGAYYRER